MPPVGSFSISQVNVHNHADFILFLIQTDNEVFFCSNINIKLKLSGEIEINIDSENPSVDIFLVFQDQKVEDQS